MRLTVSYEWLVEEMDEHDDILEVNHFDTLTEATRFARSVVDSDEEIVRSVIALRRDELGPDGSVDGDRAYCYFVDGKLVGEFQPPKRFLSARCPREFWGKEGF